MPVAVLWAALLATFLLQLALPAASDARPPKRAAASCSFVSHATKAAKRAVARHRARCARVRGPVRAVRGEPLFGSNPLIGVGQLPAPGTGSAPASTRPSAPGAGAPVQGSPAPQPADPPAVPAGSGRNVQVIGVEWALRPSRGVVGAGTVRVEYNLMGAEDGHDLVLVRSDGTGDVLRFEEQPSQTVTSQDLQLSAGRWTLFCDLPGHAANGMEASLTVR
jgi:hypothetical protein